MSGITSTSTVNALIQKTYSKFTAGYDAAKNTINEIYKLRPTRFNFEDTGAIKTLPAAQRVTEGANVFSAGFNTIGSKRFQVWDYAISLPITYQILRDNLYPQMAPLYGKNLYASQMQTMNAVGAGIINNAQSATNVGWDGQPFASASHPFDGGVQTNLTTTSSTVSESTVRLLCQQIWNLKDEAGKQITSFYAKKLIVNQSKIFDARVVLDSLTRVGVAGASALEINPANGSIAQGYSMNQYLNNNIMLMLTNVPGLRCLEREKLKIFQLGNPANLSILVTSLLSYAMDFDDYKVAQFAIA